MVGNMKTQKNKQNLKGNEWKHKLIIRQEVRKKLPKEEAYKILNKEL